MTAARAVILAVTDDDVLAPLSKQPVSVSRDNSPGYDCRDPMDRVRGFYSQHDGGAFFVFADTSVRFIDEQIDPATYLALSTIDAQDLIVESP